MFKAGLHPVRPAVMLLLAAALIAPALPAIALEPTQVPLPGGAGIVQVIHTPPGVIPAGRSVTLEARLEGTVTQENVVEARLWFKHRDDDAYRYDEMLPQLESFTGTIPAEAVEAPGLDYYFEFILEPDTSITYPAGAPRGEALRLEVRAAGAGVDQQQSPLVVISPDAFSTVYEAPVLLAVAFNRSVREVDPSKIQVRMNGRNITGKLSVSEQLVIGTLTDLKPGRKTVQVVTTEGKTPEVLGEFSFTFNPEAARRRGISELVDARFATEGRYQKYLGEGARIAREIFNVRLRSDRWILQGNGRITSEEQGHLQPQNRYTVKAGLPWAIVTAGDVKPRYNELMLWSRRVRGVELDVNTGPVRLQAIYGNLTRSVDGRFEINSITDTSGTRQDTLFDPGTYRRWLAAARVSYGMPNRLMFGITAMKVRDDSTSIQYGGQPKDNLVTGLDVEAYFDRRRISFTGEAALSLTNDNMLEPPLEDARSFHNLIYINQYFDPLPDDGLPGEGEELDVTKLAQSIFKYAFSYKGRMRLRYYKNDLQAGYRLINRSYRTLASPTLSNDQQGFFVRDRIRLMNSRVYLNGGYERYWDNVTGKGDVRNIHDIYDVGLSFYTGQYLPDVSISFRSQDNENDGIYSVLAADTATATYDTTDTRTKDVTNTINFVLSQRLMMGDMTHDVSISAMTMNRDDEYSELGDADVTTLSLSARSRYQQPFTTTLTLSSSKNQAQGDATDLTYNMINFRTDLLMLNRKLVPYGGARMTIGYGQARATFTDPATYVNPADYAGGTGDPDYQQAVTLARATTPKTQHMDFTRIDFLAGFRWEISQRHMLRGDLSFTQYVERGTIEYWNGNSFEVDQEQVTNAGYQFTQTSANIDRNDIVAMLTYELRF